MTAAPGSNPHRAALQTAEPNIRAPQAQGDALYDLAVLTLGHEEHLDDVVAGYGTDVDLDAIRGWWLWRSLVAVRWLVEHGFDPSQSGCEFES